MDNAVRQKIKVEPRGEMDDDGSAMLKLELGTGRGDDSQRRHAAEATSLAVFASSGGNHCNAYSAPAAAASVKTPRYSGGSNWEAFHAQFKLLADAKGWAVGDKALQLALCLEGDALSCLLLLDSEQRRCYDAPVGALKRRFGTWSQPALVKNELRGRYRRPGKSLRELANDIES